MALARTPDPVAMIPARDPMSGTSFVAAMIMPHTRGPTPVPIPTTARTRQTRGLHAPQINRTVKTMATVPTNPPHPSTPGGHARNGADASWCRSPDKEKALNSCGVGL